MPRDIAHAAQLHRVSRPLSPSSCCTVPAHTQTHRRSTAQPHSNTHHTHEREGKTGTGYRAATPQPTKNSHKKQHCCCCTVKQLVNHIRAPCGWWHLQPCAAAHIYTIRQPLCSSHPPAMGLLHLLQRRKLHNSSGTRHLLHARREGSCLPGVPGRCFVSCCICRVETRRHSSYHIELEAKLQVENAKLQVKSHTQAPNQHNQQRPTYSLALQPGRLHKMRVSSALAPVQCAAEPSTSRKKVHSTCVSAAGSVPRLSCTPAPLVRATLYTHQHPSCSPGIQPQGGTHAARCASNACGLCRRAYGARPCLAAVQLGVALRQQPTASTLRAPAGGRPCVCACEGQASVHVVGAQCRAAPRLAGWADKAACECAHRALPHPAWVLLRLYIHRRWRRVGTASRQREPLGKPGLSATNEAVWSKTHHACCCHEQTM